MANSGRTTIIHSILLAKVQKLQSVTFNPIFDPLFAKIFSNCNYLLTENPFLPIIYIVFTVGAGLDPPASLQFAYLKRDGQDRPLHCLLASLY